MYILRRFADNVNIERAGFVHLPILDSNPHEKK